MKQVPNEHAVVEADYKIAIVGEAPGETEEELGRPFVGRSGDLLFHLARKAGIQRSASFVGNVCQVRPPNNQIARFKWDGWQIQQGLEVLFEDIAKADPNLVLLAGATAYQAAYPAGKLNINDARGGLFMCTDTASPFFNRKCMATFHPAAVLRQWDWMPLLLFDLQRAREEASFPELRLPQRRLHTDPTADEIIAFLHSLSPSTLLCLDIEGGVDGISAIGFSIDPSYAIVWTSLHHSDHDNVRIFKEVQKVMLDSSIPKVGQNLLYDTTCMAIRWKMPIMGIQHDTMLSGWEIYPELPKALGVQASIYTKEPPYKWERKTDSFETFLAYNAKDAAVTLEIHQAHQRILQGTRGDGHYRFNVDLLAPVAYMMQRGIRYDHEKAKARERELEIKQQYLLSAIKQHAGVPLNPGSPKQMVDVLYKRMGFETQYKKEAGRRTNTPTADLEALLTLAKKFDHPIISLILQWRSLEGVRKQTAILPDPDGRIRCSYNIVGTETGRLTCSKSPSGRGTNLQTITKQNRDLYCADPGFHFFQCDLEGADGWTVAAELASLGSETMLLDYYAGIKPARVVALMFLQQTGEIPLKGSINQLSRDDLKHEISKVTIPEWLYFTCKRAQHGTNYLVGERTMSNQIVLDSYKVFGNPVYIAPKECRQLQNLYLQRYPVYLWQNKVQTELNKNRSLTAASGATREFFGRPNDHDTLKEALAHVPQANTTYATNLAMSNLWHFPDNRTNSFPPFVVEPLHQVHDAICGQFRIGQESTAIPIIRRAFDNPLTIAGIPITIPFEGNYGPNWKDMSLGSI